MEEATAAAEYEVKMAKKKKSERKFLLFEHLLLNVLSAWMEFSTKKGLAYLRLRCKYCCTVKIAMGCIRNTLISLHLDGTNQNANKQNFTKQNFNKQNGNEQNFNKQNGTKQNAT